MGENQHAFPSYFQDKTLAERVFVRKSLSISRLSHPIFNLSTSCIVFFSWASIFLYSSSNSLANARSFALASSGSFPLRQEKLFYLGTEGFSCAAGLVQLHFCVHQLFLEEQDLGFPCVTIRLIVLRFLLISLSNRGAHLIVSVYLI